MAKARQPVISPSTPGDQFDVLTSRAETGAGKEGFPGAPPLHAARRSLFDPVTAWKGHRLIMPDCSPARH